METSPNVSKKKSVAVLGGGIAGVASAKNAQDCGLDATIFEQFSSFGGVWRKEDGFTWESLKTNFSKFKNQFLDHVWSNVDEMFPKHTAICDFILDYAMKNKLNEKAVFYAKIVKVVMVTNSADISSPSFKVTWEDTRSGALTTREFDFVIIATGVYSNPIIPYFKGIENFSGTKIHSHMFKTPRTYIGRKVLVIGSAISATEIASEITVSAQKVINLVRNPILVLTRRVKSGNRVLPHDLTLVNTKVDQEKDVYKSLDEIIASNNKKFDALYESNNRNDDIAVLQIDKTKKRLVSRTISDNYLEYVKKGLIHVVKSEIKEFKEKSVVFVNEQEEEIDDIIYCTGYNHDLSYLDDQILKTISYEKNNGFMGQVLYKGTYHPSIKSLGFVGMYKSVFWTGFELQSKLLSLLFSGSLKYPTPEKEKEILEKEHLLKQKGDYLNSPYDNMRFYNSLASEIGCLPDFDKIKENDREVYDLLYNKPFVIQQYMLYGPLNNYAEAKEYLKTFQDMVKPRSPKF